MTAMRRFLLLLLIGSNALAAGGRTRAVSPGNVEITGNSVTGIVSSVNGSLVSLAGGLIVVDTAGAKVSGDIAAGSLIVAVIKSGDVAANAPLSATAVVVTPLVPVTLSGTVGAVDRANATLTVLGRTVRTNAQTRFSGLLTLLPMSLNDIFPGQSVLVETSVAGGALTATSVRVLTIDVLLPPNQIHLSGVVKSIAATQWVIGGPPGSLSPDVIVLVNASTKINGEPKVGDRVDVVGDVTASGIVASSITKQ